MNEQDPIDTFRQEASDFLDQLEQTLLDLEGAPDDRRLIANAFRAMHTLKGSGAMFGFDDVAAFMHEFETAFDRLRKTSAPAESALVTAALAAKDHVRALIDAPGATDPLFGQAILAELRDLTGEGRVARDVDAKQARQSSASGAQAWRISMRFAPNVLCNGANPLALLDDLRALGLCEPVVDIERLPPLEDLDPAQCHVAWNVRLETASTRDAIEAVFEFVRDEMELQIEPWAAVPAQSAPKESAGEPQQLPQAQRTERANATMRVQAERLDRLMDRVGELVITQARLSQLSQARRDPALQSVSEEIERLVGGLRDAAMGMRMVPIGSLFGRFRRLVHDLSRELDKPVEFVTRGEDTELDKTVIERLADPLVHLIRNAIDHGVESKSDRRTAGKPERGTIRLCAGHVGAEVHIVIEDDGHGIDAERLRTRGEALGLLTPGAQVSEADLFALMFTPGFSTARTISALSGRGVGMDVVKTTVESLRGKIDIESKPGQGARFTLRLPLTLAIIDGLLVRVGEGRYIIPLSAVEECVELNRADEMGSGRRSFLNVRGELVPFLRLRDAFRIDAGQEPYQKVVIVSAGGSRIGLVVDQIIGSQQVVIKSLSRLHRDVRAFSGATILGDGLPALILDIGQLVLSGDNRITRDREAA